MPLTIPVNHGMIRWFITGGPSDPIITTLGFEAGLGVVSPADAAEGARDAFVGTGSLIEVLCNNYTLDRVEVEMNTGGPFHATAIAPSGAPFLVNFASVPPAVCMLIRKKTLVGGRPNRGRFYWPGLAEQNVNSDGFIEPVTLAAYRTAVNTFYSRLVAEGIQPRVLHTSPAVAPTTVVSFELDAQVATQRKRQR